MDINPAILFDEALFQFRLQNRYDSSHSWWYKYNTPKTPLQIMKKWSKEIEVKIKKPVKSNFEASFNKVIKELENSIAIYLSVCREKYKPMPWETSKEEINSGRRIALSLTHNHILYYKSQLNYLIRIAAENNISFKC